MLNGIHIEATELGICLTGHTDLHELPVRIITALKRWHCILYTYARLYVRTVGEQMDTNYDKQPF